MKNARTAQQMPTDASAAHERQLTALYEQHVAFVWRSVRMLGVSPDAADDAVQDVFVVAHRRLADFEARSGPRTWLFAIAMRVVSDHKRSKRRRLNLLERAQTVEHRPACSPFDTTADAELRRALLGALESLPEEQRIAFALAELEELTVPEIATALGVKLNTVYSRLRVARRAVADKLRETLQTSAQESP
jgi:RNA polymerase sigma-70 factor (ECF subfamily)